MNFKNLIEDNDAVSPVIGVILMVAITVILAAVIGTFVLGLGDQVSNTAPSASFSFDFDSSDSTRTSFGPNGASGTLTMTHDGGDKISASQIYVSGSSSFSGKRAWSKSGELEAQGTTIGTGADTYTAGMDITAGSSLEIGADKTDTVRVIWESSNGGDTATLGKWAGPDA